MKSLEVTSIQLPFQKLSKTWYSRRGSLAVKNESRGKAPLVGGTLNDNIAMLKENIDKCSNTTELKAILEVAKYLTEKGPVVSGNELAQVYQSKKENLTNRKAKGKI
jgi:hypothetical protein